MLRKKIQSGDRARQSRGTVLNSAKWPSLRVFQEKETKEKTKPTVQYSQGTRRLPIAPGDKSWALALPGSPGLEENASLTLPHPPSPTSSRIRKRKRREPVYTSRSTEACDILRCKRHLVTAVAFSHRNKNQVDSSKEYIATATDRVTSCTCASPCSRKGHKSVVFPFCICTKSSVI